MFTEKQQRFIDAYAGNGTEAARLAGYAGDDNALAVRAAELLRNSKIAEAIGARQKKASRRLIASREERQEFWSKVMLDDLAHMQDRLRASELLAKSEADFVQKVEHSGKVTLEDLVAGSPKADE